MQGKIWKWIAPVAAAALVVMLLWLGSSGTAKVYGMSDVPALLKSARTLHIVGWGEFPDEGPGKMKGPRPIEYWFDIEQGRRRTLSTSGDLDENGKPLMMNTVCDGQYVMDQTISQRPGQPWEKLVRFRRITPFQARLQAYKATQGIFTRFLGNLDRVAGFQKTGEETIDGTLFHIWGGQISNPAMAQMVINVQAWLAPGTGQIGRIRIWGAMDPARPGSVMRIEFSKVERDVAVSPEVFRTEPLAGIRVDGAKESAPLDVLGFGADEQVERYGLYANIGFTLPDGSVLLGWSSPEKGVDQTKLFASLAPGGPLPELPAVITGLTTVPPVAGGQYVGRHLAYTRKGTRYIEWTLYVPTGTSARRDSFLQYQFETRKNADDGIYATWAAGLSEDLEITGEADFQTWVCGAMAELSDDGHAPPQVTCDWVLAQSRQIRAATRSAAAPASRPAS